MEFKSVTVSTSSSSTVSTAAVVSDRVETSTPVGNRAKDYLDTYAQQKHRAKSKSSLKAEKEAAHIASRDVVAHLQRRTPGPKPIPVNKRAANTRNMRMVKKETNRLVHPKLDHEILTAMEGKDKTLSAAASLRAEQQVKVFKQAGFSPGLAKTAHTSYRGLRDHEGSLIMHGNTKFATCGPRESNSNSVTKSVRKPRSSSGSGSGGGGRARRSTAPRTTPSKSTSRRSSGGSTAGRSSRTRSSNSRSSTSKRSGGSRSRKR